MSELRDLVEREIPLTTARNAYDLLTEIERLAIEEPARINMGVVCLRGKNLLETISKNLVNGLAPALGVSSVKKASSCNTVGCIAGWTLVRTGYSHANHYNSGDTERATSILGLTNSQNQELFFPNYLTGATNKQTRDHAREVVRHIRAFKAKYKDQLLAHPIVLNQ